MNEIHTLSSELNITQDMNSKMPKAIRLFAKFILPFIPKKTRILFKRFLVQKLMYPAKEVLVTRYDNKKICVSTKGSVDMLFEGDPNFKRYNKNNYIPVLQNLVKPGNVVIDIGASYGDEVLDLSDLVGPTGQVHAFEPDLSDFQALCKTIKLNKITNVSCHNMAVGSHDGEIILSKLKENTRTTNTDKLSENHQKVPCTTIDSFVQKNLSGKKINFIKIDTDGYEIEVMQGSQNTLSSNPQCTVLA